MYSFNKNGLISVDDLINNFEGGKRMFNEKSNRSKRMGQHSCFKRARSKRRGNLRCSIARDKSYRKSLKDEDYFYLINTQVDGSALAVLAEFSRDWEPRTHKGSSWKKSCNVKHQYDKGKRAYNYSFKNSAINQYQESWDEFEKSENDIVGIIENYTHDEIDRYCIGFEDIESEVY